MSKKHEQRSRAAILDKRKQDELWFKAMPIRRRPRHRSKYVPHFGKKQAAKIDGSYYVR